MRIPIVVDLFPLGNQTLFIEEQDKDKWERMNNPKCAEDYGLSVTLHSTVNEEKL